MNKSTILALLAIFVLFSSPTVASEDAPGVYVILDGSGSMWGQLPSGTHKITAAREVLRGFSADDYAGRELAFRVYGHRRKGDCSDSELVVPFSAPERAIDLMSSFAEEVNPKGKTPISRSLRAALEDFGDRKGEIILISDGIETCDEDPCALMKAWQNSGVDIRVHVVGLGLEEKERAAMECISEAAGTKYFDAQSADELAVGLTEIQKGTNEESSGPPPDWKALDILASNKAGDRMRVVGTALSESGDSFEVGSGSHNRLPLGTFQVTVGVKTWNGSLYEPVTQTITVEGQGVTKLEVIVPEPPSVKARFIEDGQEVRGSFVNAYQGSKNVFGFRAIDRAYLDPGTYSFRTRPNADNELSVQETFAEGDHKEILFEMTQTVVAFVKMVAEGSGIDFRTNYELWQEGERKYQVHWSNGVRALPGTYDLKLPLRLTPYTHEGLTLTTEPNQDIRVEVPVGHVTIQYQNADGTPFAKEARCFIERIEGKKYLKDKVSTSGRKIPLVEGRYRVQGWSHVGDFDPVFFEIALGDDKTVHLKNKSEVKGK